MSLRAYESRFEFIADLNDKELDFIENYIYQTEDGLYYIEKGDGPYSIDVAIKKAISKGDSDENELSELLAALKNALGKNEYCLNFSIS